MVVRDKLVGSILVVGASILLFVVSSKIGFMQNDDWVHYRTVSRFLSGDFTLEPIIGSTFYTQGIIATLWARLLGIQSVPVLTAIISIGSIWLLILLLHRLMSVNFLVSCLLGLLLIFNPIFLYSSYGFMTDNYLLFFIVLALYAFRRYEISPRHLTFILLNLISIFGFFIKQNFIAVFIALVIYFFVQRKYKIMVTQLGITTVILVIYYFLFPQTEIMRGQSPQLSQLLNLKYAYSIMYAICIYIVAFFAPLFIVYSWMILKPLSTKAKVMQIAIGIISGVSMLWLFNHFHVIESIFPFFTNTFTMKGFYPYGLDGNKYQWRFFYTSFKLWYLMSVFILGLFLTLISGKIAMLNIRKIPFYFVLFIVWFGITLVTPKIYDRYLLVLFPIVILGITDLTRGFQVRFSNAVMVSFIIPLALIGCLYSLDFFGWESYVWEKSRQLSEDGVHKDMIYATHAWNAYNSGSEIPEYKFTFDSPEVLSDDNYGLIEKKEVDFVGNLFISPYVYLYKAVNTE